MLFGGGGNDRGMVDKIIEDAERVLTITLNRYQQENDSSLKDAGITAILPDIISHCILAFRIDCVEREDTYKHDAPKPITDFFVAQATLAITARPHTRTSLSELRANATDMEIITRRYQIKHFDDGDWLVIFDDD